MGERRSSAQDEQRQGESCETRSGQPACIGRPAHVEAAARLRVSHAAEHEEPVETTDLSARGRRIPTGWWRTKHRALPRTRYGGALRPWCPTARAIDSQRQTGVQRRKRSTPNHRTGVQRAKGLSLQPPDWTEDEGLSQLRRFGPRCLRRTSVNSASAAFPRGRPGESESSSGHARATGTTHPGFYGRKPWRKPNSEVIITGPAPR